MELCLSGMDRHKTRSFVMLLKCATSRVIAFSLAIVVTIALAVAAAAAAGGILRDVSKHGLIHLAGDRPQSLGLLGPPVQKTHLGRLDLRGILGQVGSAGVKTLPKPHSATPELQGAKPG